MQQEAVAEFVTVAPAGFDGGEHPVPFGAIHRVFQAGRLIILGVYRQNKSEDDVVSFLTRHVIHPVSKAQAIFYPRSMERVKGGGDPSPMEEDRHPQAESPIDPR
jgi:hypothetical protein